MNAHQKINSRPDGILKNDISLLGFVQISFLKEINRVMLSKRQSMLK